MKKITRAITALVLTVLLLTAAGCSTPSPASDASSSSEASEAASEAASAAITAAADSQLDPDNPVTVTLWHYYTGDNQQALEGAVSEFNQSVGRDSGVIVEAVAMGSLSDLENAVTDSAKGVIHSEEMPGIFSCYADKALELDELDALCDLSTYFTEEERAQYVPQFIEDGTFDGRVLVLPIVKSTELLYVNKTAMDEFTAADSSVQAESDLSSWQSLYDVAQKYYDWTDAQTPDTPWDGKGFMGIDELANFLIVSNEQLGVEIMDGDTATVNLNQDTLRTIFDIYYPAWCLGYFDQVGRFCSDDVRTGDLAAYIGSSSSAAYFPTTTEDGSEIELLAASYPVFDGGTPYTIQQGAGMAVSKSDPAKEEGACLFLKWFTDVSQNVPFAMKTGYLPVKSAAYESEEFDTALSELTEGDSGAKNVGQVYSIALEAVTDGQLYAVKPFADSYDVRSTLKNTLSDSAAAGKEKAAPLKAEGMSADEILASLDLDAEFTAWLDAVRSELDYMNVKYLDT